MLARMHGLQRCWRTCSKVMEAKLKQSNLFLFSYGKPKHSKPGLIDPNVLLASCVPLGDDLE